MTEKDLNEYQHLCAEIMDLSRRIERERNEELLELYEEQRAKSEKKKIEIEKAIEAIEKPDVRAIFRYRCLDGMTLEEIGKKLNYTRGNIFRILKKYANGKE